MDKNVDFDIWEKSFNFHPPQNELLKLLKQNLFLKNIDFEQFELKILFQDFPELFQ